MQRALIIGVTVVAVTLIGAIAASTRRPHVAPVLTAQVTRGDIEQSVLAGGSIVPLRVVNIGAQASGRILKLHVVLGGHVHEGDLIAEIDGATERNALATAKAALDQARAQCDSRRIALHQLEQAFQRAKITFAQEAISQTDYDMAEAAYRGTQKDVIALEAAVHGAQISVDTAQVTLGFTRVVAPMEGTVIAVVAQEGQTVNAVQSAPTLVKLADLSTMTVGAKVSEADIMSVKPGQRVYFTTLGNSDKRYYGTLRALEPAPDSFGADTAGQPGVSAPSSVTSTAVYYTALFEVANPALELWPAMTASVHIIVGEAKNVLVLPLGALGQRRTDGAFDVSVLETDGRFRIKQIRLGIESGTMAQVLEGLKEGEQVILGSVDPVAPNSGRPAGFL